MVMPYVVAFLFLFLLGLLLLLALEWHGERRSRKWLTRAVAISINDDAVDIPITVEETPVPTSFDVRCEGVKLPMFMTAERRLTVRDWGRN